MSFTKIASIKDLTISEIDDKIKNLKIEIINLKIKQATRQNIDSHIFKHKKHELAQLLTAKTEKSIINYQ